MVLKGFLLTINRIEYDFKNVMLILPSFFVISWYKIDVSQIYKTWVAQYNVASIEN